jgi:hypothetical protein
MVAITSGVAPIATTRGTVLEPALRSERYAVASTPCRLHRRDNSRGLDADRGHSGRQVDYAVLVVGEAVGFEVRAVYRPDLA